MKKTTGVVLVLILLLGGVYLASNKTSTTSNLDEFSKCLSEKGVKMWGAYWCPHCKNQKAEFGSSWENIDYVECSLPGGSGQTKECTDAGIKGYPTWEFEGRERIEGEVPLEILSEKTGCELPNE